MFLVVEAEAQFGYACVTFVTKVFCSFAALAFYSRSRAGDFFYIVFSRPAHTGSRATFTRIILHTTCLQRAVSCCAFCCLVLFTPFMRLCMQTSPLCTLTIYSCYLVVFLETQRLRPFHYFYAFRTTVMLYAAAIQHSLLMPTLYSAFCNMYCLVIYTQYIYIYKQKRFEYGTWLMCLFFIFSSITNVVA